MRNSQLWIEKVGGNREEVAIDSHRQLYFKKMRFSGGEMMFHKLEFRSVKGCVRSKRV